MGDIIVFLFFGLVFFVILFLKGKIKQKEIEGLEKKRGEVPLSPSLPPRRQKVQSHLLRAQAPSYEVEEKKKFSFLSKGWNKKASLKQAFILSEILKRKDEF